MDDTQIRNNIKTKIISLLSGTYMPEEILFLNQSYGYKLNSSPTDLQTALLTKVDNILTNYNGLESAKHILYLKKSINIDIDNTLSNKYSNII